MFFYLGFQSMNGLSHTGINIAKTANPVFKEFDVFRYTRGGIGDNANNEQAGLKMTLAAMSELQDAEQNFPVGATTIVKSKECTVTGVEHHNDTNKIHVHVDMVTKTGTVPAWPLVKECSPATNIPPGVTQAGRYLSTRKYKQHCMPHIGNLLQGGFAELEQFALPLFVVHEIAKLNKNCVEFRDELHRQQKACGIAVHEIAMAGDTRWNDRRNGCNDVMKSMRPLQLVPAHKPKMEYGKYNSAATTFKQLGGGFVKHHILVKEQLQLEDSQHWKWLPRCINVFECIHDNFIKPTQADGLALGRGVDDLIRSHRVCKELYAERAEKKAMDTFIDNLYLDKSRHILVGDDSHLYFASWYLLPTGGDGDKEPINNMFIPKNIVAITQGVLREHMDSAFHASIKDTLTYFTSRTGPFSADCFNETLKGGSKLACKQWWRFVGGHMREPHQKAFARAARLINGYPCAAASVER
eukprot:gene3353-220_t